MKYRINYGDGVGVFPKSALDVVKRAGECELKVLLCLCAAEGNTDEKKIAKTAGLTAEAVHDAIAFWRGAGIIEGDRAEDALSVDGQKTAFEAETASAAGAERKPKIQRSGELPDYTSAQLADILEERKDTATLINECQNIIGKVFSVHEINILIGLVDYLALDCEYIMILLTYCVSIGKKTLHYVEKLAFALYDSGICTPAELSEELRRRELVASSEGRIRTMFGIGERAFSSKEKKLISAWLGEMGYGMDVIEKAFEITVNTTTKASIPYANSILERWHAEGLKALSDIEESYKKKEAEKADGNSTFTDGFFDAAVRRALGDN